MTNEVSPFNLFCHCVHGLTLFFNIKFNGMKDLPTFKFDLPAFSFAKFGHTFSY